MEDWKIRCEQVGGSLCNDFFPKIYISGGFSLYNFADLLQIRASQELRHTIPPQVTSCQSSLLIKGASLSWVRRQAEEGQIPSAAWGGQQCSHRGQLWRTSKTPPTPHAAAVSWGERLGDAALSNINEVGTSQVLGQQGGAWRGRGQPCGDPPQSTAISDLEWRCWRLWTLLELPREEDAGTIYQLSWRDVESSLGVALRLMRT